MHKYVKELLGGSLIYGIAGMVTGVVAIFLVPIYTRMFSPADYGVLSLVNVTYFLLTIFVIASLDNSAALWYWELTEEEERKKTFASWAYFSFAFSLILAGGIILLSQQISTLLFKDTQYYYLLNLMAAALVVTSLQKVVNMWFRVRKKPVWATAYALTVSLTMAGLSILLVVKLDYGLAGVFWAQIGSGIISFVLAIVLMAKWFLPKYLDFARLREMLIFALPMIPASVSFWLMNSASSYFVSHYTNSTEVGLYQLGYTLASGISLATVAFMQAWSPFAFSIAKNEDHRQTYADVFLVYVYWCGFAVMGVFLFAPEVLAILAPASFSGAAFVAGLLGLNVAILSLPSIVVIGCALVRTTAPYSKAVIIGSIISVLLFMLMIPVWGKEGAAIASILGNIFIFLYVFYNAQKLYFIPYNLSKASLVFVVAVILSILCLWASNNQSPAIMLFVKLSLIIGYAGFALFASYKIKNNLDISPS